MVATTANNPAFVPYRSQRALKGCRCHTKAPATVSGLGMSLFTKIIRASTPGPNEFKLQSTPSEIKKVIAVAGPALALLPGYGKIAAAGAAVITAADQRLKQQRLASAAGAANAADFVNQYTQVAGTIPGRVLGQSLITQVWQAMVAAGLFKGHGSGKTSDVPDVYNGCPKCTDGTVEKQVSNALAQGVTDPAQILDQFLIPEIQRSSKNKWAWPSSDLERQILIDAIDQKLYSKNSSVPLNYAQPAPDQPLPPQATGSGPVAQPAAPALSIGSQPIGYTNDANGLPVFAGSDGNKYVAQNGQWALYTGAIRAGQSTTSAVVATPAPTPTPIVTATPAPTPLPATVPPDQTAALIQQLMAQGASQQQAFTAALQSLAAQGVNTSAPAVQQQVAADVQSAGLFGGMDKNTLFTLGAGTLAAVLFFAASRHGKKRSRR